MDFSWKYTISDFTGYDEAKSNSIAACYILIVLKISMKFNTFHQII